MALSRKRQRLYDLSPDIAIIPECSRTCLSRCIAEGFAGRWFGNNEKKGLGVLVGNAYRIVRSGKPCNRWIAPLWISGPTDFLLLAVWAMKVEGSLSKSYIGQVYESIVAHPHWFRRNKVVIAGDFNSNKIWDEMRQLRNHSAVVTQLQKHRIASAYHELFTEKQGEETQPTYFHWRRGENGYHIDYIFLPYDWIPRVTKVEVGAYQTWSKLSDHVPVIVEVEVDAPGPAETH